MPLDASGESCIFSASLCPQTLSVSVTLIAVLLRIRVFWKDGYRYGISNKVAERCVIHCPVPTLLSDLFNIFCWVLGSGAKKTIIFITHAWGIMKFPGRGSNPCYSSDLSHCSTNARSLTYYTEGELLEWQFFNNKKKTETLSSKYLRTNHSNNNNNNNKCYWAFNENIGIQS